MKIDDEQDKKGAGVKIPPPLIFLGSILIGYLIGFIHPLRIGDSSGIMLGGSLLVALALIIIIIAALSFHRVKTHLEPWKPTSTIVTGGIFAISRNPIYLAFCCANIGLGMIFNSWWILLSFMPTAILIYFFAIKPEEVYLERKFGGEYQSYKMKVRRWL